MLLDVQGVIVANHAFYYLPLARRLQTFFLGVGPCLYHFKAEVM